MPFIVPAVMASQTPAGPAGPNGPKLRTACDNCQLSKVRCSRGKPSCWRCSQSGIACVYSPLRRTGRPPKNSDNSASSQGGKGTSRRGSTNNTKSRSPRVVTQVPSPDSTGRNRPSPHDGTASDVQQARSPATTQRNGTMSSSVSASETSTTNSGETTASQEPAQHSLVSMPTVQMDCGVPDFSALDMDMDLDMGMWVMPCMSDLELHGAHGDITSTIRAVTQSEDPSHFTFSSILASPSDIHDAVGVQAMQSKPALFPFDNNTLRENADETMTNFNFANRPPTTSSSSHNTSHTGTTTASISPNSHDHPRPCSHDETCHRALSELLTKLGDFDISHPGAMQLDGLLCMDRELQRKVRMAIECRRCIEKPSNQNLLMMIYMSLDSLLSLFEKQQRQQNGFPGRSGASLSQNASAARRRSMLPHATQPSHRLQQLDSNDQNMRGHGQFPWTEQTLVVGSFPVDDVVKASFLQRLVLEYIDNVLSILAELDAIADTIMQGVNSIIHKHKAEDIYKRAYFLRARLLLAADMGST
ncbi:hypothetical protein NLG97_g1696 [Lecanicillium saksenae]|uniref:Uncharacterized protein n=1 Tax=Lecanicillium saksenae TaxID=468837 RepID=A0ACC1R6F6_9HYPO|nr:hypothetical protein NLG97_g1696 [Lecanicillium saksenae]